MPGILPMKVIKVGSSSQNRIAQACDRCRSKKIRCDGIRPCCSQCANVGFECKTSDKLSRRAFPRGYTESLEEKVRALEAEIRELKDLLDEKDEKIDILSKMHSQSSFSAPRPSPPRRRSSTQSQTSRDKASETEARDETFRPPQLPSLLDGEYADPYFMGGSSGRAFVDSFKRKLRKSGKPCLDFDTEVFFSTRSRRPVALPAPPLKSDPPMSSGPSRMISDQLINIYFQEWAPLFPVLHRPTFLRHYEKYTAGEDLQGSQEVTAQLHLVFSIAAISGTSANQADVVTCERQWQGALDAILSRSTLGTLQCLVLAQMHSIAQGNHTKLLRYKGIAIGLSQRLGLHQCQKRFSLGALTCESRKKVFWTLYTLDCFSAALLGLPMAIKEDDIQVEYPVDADDECVTEMGFLPAPSGESTKLSSALALFRACRVLSKVLAVVYPALEAHEISLQTLKDIEDDLNTWSNSLAPHLKLQFIQGRPSTNLISSRSPILSLVYYYIRTLIHRCAVGSNLGPKASTSILALADSSKHIIQVVQLLEERKMSFSLCLNKHELLILSGFGLLFQGLDLDSEGKLCKVGERLVTSVVDILNRENAYGAQEFQKVARFMISNIDGSDSEPSSSEDKLGGDKLAPDHSRKPVERPVSRSSANGEKDNKAEDATNIRRATFPALPIAGIHKSRSQSQLSFTTSRSEPLLRPPNNHRNSSPVAKSRHCYTSAPFETPNLDYLPMPSDSGVTGIHISNINKPYVSSTSWGRFVQDNADAQSYSYNSYSGPPIDVPINSYPTSAGLETYVGKSWPSNAPWDTGALCNDVQQPAQPFMRHSDDSFASEEVPNNGAESYVDVLGSSNSYQAMFMPNYVGNGEGFTLDGLNGNYGL